MAEAARDITFSDIKSLGNRPQLPLLRLYSQGEFIETVALQLGNNLVGRDRSNQVFLDSSFVSRHHFLIEVFPEGAARLQDLKSRNGTYLNRKQIGDAKLTDSDRISCGPFEFLLIIPDAFSEKGAKLAPNELIARDEQTDIGFGSEKSEESSMTAVGSPFDPEHKAQEEESLNLDGLAAADDHFEDFADAASTSRRAAPIGLSSPSDMPPTLEADAHVLPDRVVLKKKKTAFWKQLLGYGLMVLISAALAYVFFLWRHGMLEQFIGSVDKIQQKSGSESSFQENSDPKPAEKAPKKTTKRKKQRSKKNKNRSANAQKKAPPKSKKQAKIPSVKDLKIDSTLNEVLADSPSLKVADQLYAWEDTRSGKKIKKGLSQGKLLSMKISVNTKSPDAKVQRGNRGIPLHKLNQNFQNELRGKLSFVQSCYVDHAKSHEQAGTVNVKMTLDRKGKVMASNIDTSVFRTRAFDKCISNRLARLRTSKPPWSPYESQYKFRFLGKKSVSFP